MTVEPGYRRQRRRARRIQHVGWALVFLGLVIGVVWQLGLFFDSGRSEYDVTAVGYSAIPMGHGGAPSSPWPAIGLGGGIALIGVLLNALARIRLLRFPGPFLTSPDDDRE